MFNTFNFMAINRCWAYVTSETRGVAKHFSRRVGGSFKWDFSKGFFLH